MALPPDLPPRSSGPVGPDPFADVEPRVESGYVPPDPNEPPPVELWSAVGDVPPFATVLVLLACGVIFAGQAMRGEVGDTAGLIAWGGNLSGATGLDGAWRRLASTLIHGGAMHLLLNAVSLLMFGPAVEAIFARAGFWTIYVTGGAIASQASLTWRAWRHGGALLSVGASGAIFALAGALLVAAFRLRRRLAPGRARALAGAMLFLIAQSLSGGATQYGTDNAAHVAGLLAGAGLGALVPLNVRLGGRGAGVPANLAGGVAALALAAAFIGSLVIGFATP